METPDQPESGKIPQKQSPDSRLASYFGAVISAISGGIRFIVVSILSALIITGRWIGARLWQVSVIVARAVWKFIITVWRLASALDSALWRATKLMAHRFWAASLHGAALAGLVIGSFILWLPTRTGRAYSAASGVFLVISLLWIVDMLREGPAAPDLAGGVMRAPIDDEDPILARIAGRYVHLSEIEASARANGQFASPERLTPIAAFERGLVEAYIEQRLLAGAALDSGVQRVPSVLRRINAARDRILAASLIEGRLNEAVTPETVERYYRRQRAVMEVGDEVRVRHILVETGLDAEEIVTLLDEGGDFATLARERSQDRATAPLGGEIGWVSKPMLEKTISAVAFATPVDERSAPFQTEFGWHILEVNGRRRINAKPLAEMRDDIEEFLRLEIIAQTLSELEEESQVVYYRPDRTAPVQKSGAGADMADANRAIRASRASQ